MYLSFQHIPIIGSIFLNKKIDPDIVFAPGSYNEDDRIFLENENMKICLNIIKKCDSYIKYSAVQVGVSSQKIKSIETDKSILSYSGQFSHVFKQHYKL